jgi:hypothetical protein
MFAAGDCMLTAQLLPNSLEHIYACAVCSAVTFTLMKFHGCCRLSAWQLAKDLKACIFKPSDLHLMPRAVCTLPRSLARITAHYSTCRRQACMEGAARPCCPHAQRRSTTLGRGTPCVCLLHSCCSVGEALTAVWGPAA